MTQECIFCDEYKRSENTFMKTDLFRARWDPIPLKPGHVEILPLRHVQYFSDLSEAEKSELLIFAEKVIEKIKDTNLIDVYEEMLRTANDFTRPYIKAAIPLAKTISSKPDAFNHGLNDGPYAGQSVPHFHYHLIPRWKGDVENPKGGIRHMFGEDAYSKLTTSKKH